MIITIALGMTGCKDMGDIELKPGEDGIYIHSDGSVTYGACEKFDKDYYDKDELNKKIEEEVADFNGSRYASVEDAISIKDTDIDSEKAEVVLDFITTYDFLQYGINYNKFDPSSFYIGTVDHNDEVDIKGKFIDAKTKKEVDKDVVEDSKDFLLVVDNSYKVQVDGTVKYYSKNCSMDKDGIVKTAGVGKVSYIVYDIEE